MTVTSVFGGGQSVAKSRENTSKGPENQMTQEPSDGHLQEDGGLPQEVPRGTEGHAQKKGWRGPEGSQFPLAKANEILRKEWETECVLKVRDLEHARSEEILSFCLKELTSGTTYNALRLKLGCGPAAVDRNWREIRSILSEMILPSDEEEALKASHALSGYMITRIEEFQKKVSTRADEMQGDKNEHFFMKLELDAMKLVTEKLDKRIEHYLHMKDLQKAEKKTRGQTIVFNNKFFIPRPGSVLDDAEPLKEAARLVGQLNKLEDE